MVDILQKLDMWLLKNRPSFYKTLNPGLSGSEIEFLEKQTGLQLPESFKQLYLWKNGQEGQVEYFFDMDIFLPFKDGIENRSFQIADLSDFNTEDDLTWSQKWMPFTHTLDGGCYFIDTEGELGPTGCIGHYYVEGNSEVQFQNIEAMMSYLLLCFNEGVYQYVKNDYDVIVFKKVNWDLADEIKKQFKIG